MILPESNCSRPAINLNKVVFPQPLGPNKQTISPFSTEKDTESTTLSPLNDLVKSVIVN